MRLRWLFIVLFLLCVVPQVRPQKSLVERYRQAILLFESDNPTAFTDSLSEAIFLDIVHDSDFVSLEKGIQLDVFGKLGTLALLTSNYDLAIDRYRTAVEIGLSNQVADSLIFDPTLYLGESYYLLGKADSSIFFLKEAEKRLQGAQAANQSARLFNSLGVIYYESGNYSQAINYFSKAKNLTVGQKDFGELQPYYQYALFSFLNNIGSCLINLNQPDSALSIYKTLFVSGIEQEKTRLQIARIFLDLQQVDSASNYLKHVGDEVAKSPYFIDLQAEALIQQAKRLEAGDLLTEYLKNREDKDFRLAPLNNKLGDLALDNGDFIDAAKNYHQAIIQADGNFEEMDIFQNPGEFGVGFASHHLFQALIGKGEAFGRHAVQLGPAERAEFFGYAYATFQAAFDFAYSVANYYDNDEARVFFSDFVLEGYRKGIKVALDEYALTGHQVLLERAFSWAEESKAIGLNIGLREKRVKKMSDVPDNLIQKERDLQFSISQIQQKIFSERDEQQRRYFNELALDKRLELSRLHSQFAEFEGYTAAKNERDSIQLLGLKSSIGRSKTLLLSFFDAGDSWLLFTLNQKSLTVHNVSNHAGIDSLVREFKTQISDVRLGKGYRSGGVGRKLFDALLSPVLPILSDFENLVVIPHTSLSGLPFEVLEKSNGQFLVAEHAISYQLSSTFFSTTRPSLSQSKTLGFAPFFSSGLENDNEALGQLPYSRMELESFDGEKFVDSAATKEKFLNKVVDANILHLATHAVAQSSQPEAAFVAFFPDQGNDRLYPTEISSLSMEHTSLVFLSACETNYGSQSKSEGIIGLSRSFAFAGCKNLITTLWKAEDKATAFISAKFYQHLENGHSYALALQHAKNDLLSDPSMAQFHHPAYWAHLILIGDLPPPQKTDWVYMFLAVLFMLGAMLVWWRHSKMKKNPSE